MNLHPADGRSRNGADRSKVERINELASGINFYDSAHNYEMADLPFRVSPLPFAINESCWQQLEVDCRHLVNYYWACEKLLPSLAAICDKVAKLLASRPTDFGANQTARHPLIRPDFILTEDGPIVVEVETSPFGLGLCCFLERSFRELGHGAVGDSAAHFDRFARAFGDEGTTRKMVIAHTDHTKRYTGQLRYLSTLMSRPMLEVSSAHIDELTITAGSIAQGANGFDYLYRAFYLHEAGSNSFVGQIVAQHQHAIVPGVNAALEEKALLALIWDPQFQSAFNDQLGEGVVKRLLDIIPETYIVDGSETPQHLGHTVERWNDLAKLSRRRRNFVLKASGYSANASWGKGVKFLQDHSAEAIVQLAADAISSETTYVLQRYHDGKRFSQPYWDTEAGLMNTLKGRVRLTPYVSTATGEIVTAKATIRAGSRYVHGATDAINTAVEVVH